MGIGTALGIAGSIAGPLISGVMGGGGGSAASSADAAARQQAEANAQARRDLSPWRTAGGSALDEIFRLQGLGALIPGADGGDFTVEQSGRDYYQSEAAKRFKTDPGYQFRVSEGEKGINRSLAARTGTLNPSATKAMMRFNQDTASAEYGNYYNRMAAIAGQGQTAAASTASTGVAGAGAVGSDLMAGGRARQSSYDQFGRAINTGISNLAGFGASRGWFGGASGGASFSGAGSIY